MVSDKQLLVVLRSTRAVALWGDLIRASVIGAVVVLIALCVPVYSGLVRFMLNEMNMDDFGKFYYSARMFLAGEDMYGASPATAIAMGDHETRQFWNMNPPHFHLVVLPLARLSPALALGVWTLLGTAALVWILFRVGRELELRWTPSRVLCTVLAVLLCSATALTVGTGQVTFLLLLPVTLSWIAARRGQLVRAGAYMGLAACIKPFLGVFLLYWLVRRQLRAIMAMIAVGLAVTVAGVAIFGEGAYMAWFRVLADVEWPWVHMNASLAGIVSRAFSENPFVQPVVIAPELIRPLSAFLSAGVGLITIAAVATDQSEHAVDRSYFLLIAASLLMSPLGWMYYAPLLAAPALALILTARARPSRTRNVLACLAVPGLLLPALDAVAWVHGRWAGVTLGSIFAWTMILLWASGLADRQAAAQPVPSGRRWFAANTRSLLATLLGIYALVYLGLAMAGTHIFIYKTFVLPALVVYGLVSRDGVRFVRDWSVFIALTVLFDAMRGAIFALVNAGVRPVFATYVITLEQWLTGSPALSLWVQESMRSEFMDRLTVTIHGSHFVFFLLFGLVVWHAKRQEFWRYRSTMLGIMGCGLICYLAVPTVPPFLAAQLGFLPPVPRIVDSVYTAFIPELYGAFDTNPVAAMPSLHIAFPVACTLIAGRIFRPATFMALVVYTNLAVFSSVYLGEHYSIDAIAGFLLALGVHSVVSRRSAPVEPPRFTTAVFAALALFGIALAIGMWAVAQLATGPGWSGAK